MSTLKLNEGSSITVKASGGTVAFTPTSLAADGAQQSAVIDFGTDRPPSYQVKLETAYDISPTGGEHLELSMARSTNGSSFDGGAGASDAAFGSSLADRQERIAQMDSVMAMPVRATTDAQEMSSMYTPKSRYGALVLLNLTDQALSATAGDHIVTFTRVTESMS